MKVLIIVSSVGNKAPEKVFSFYINLLKKYNNNLEFKVVSDNAVNNTLLKLTTHPRIKKLSISTLGYDFFAYTQAKKVVNQLDESYDIVLTMMSSSHYFSLYAGYLFKKRWQNSYWINYSVDAVPAPDGWDLSLRYKKSLVRMINYFMQRVDKLYFSNKVMLDYQMNLFEHTFKGKSGYLYPLSTTDFINFPYNDNRKKLVFLYTGSIYQARKIDQFLDAIEKLLEDGIDIVMNFVGTHPLSIDLSKYNTSMINRIKFLPYTTNLLPFYEEADILVDIDAAIEKDVFISSKFFNYIMTNKKILCITQKNSPVMQLVYEESISDIFFSIHDAASIYKVIRNMIEKKNPINRKIIGIKNAKEFLKLEILRE